MAVPKFFDFFESFLKAIQDGKIHPAGEVRETISSAMQLSEDDLAQMLPSGRVSTFYSRFAWARTYLDRAGLIETPQRGQYRITKEGKKALSSGKKIDLKYLDQFEKFREFHRVKGLDKENPKEEGEKSESQVDVNESPIEVLEDAFQQVNDKLANQLMYEVMNLKPVAFEKLVVKLLLNMGYGSGVDEAGKVTPASRDGGIDGVIKEDRLGFSHIYIQAKKWALTQTVGTPEIQKFIGALKGCKAQKGLFITTAKFSSGARDYVDGLNDPKVVLIDGKALTKLMINHDVGVSTEQTYVVKRLDTDFFSEEL